MTLQPLEIDYDTFLTEHFVLPPLPGTTTKVLEAIQSKTSGAKEVAELISLDAGMVSHILKVVNSAYYGLPRAISDLKYAIAYLGLGEISRIALTLSVINNLKPDDKEELKRFWLHSYLTAIIAKRLVKELKHVYDIEDLYAASLLHDVGKLVYQRFFPDHYRHLAQYCADHGKFFMEAEEHFGLPSHLTFGSLLCDHWRLPKPVKRACEFHELVHLKSISDRSKANPMDVVVATSNQLAALASDALANETREDIALEVRRILGRSEPEFLVLMADVYDLKLKAIELLKQIM